MKSPRAAVAACLMAASWVACTSTHNVPKVHDLMPRAVAEVARYEAHSATGVIGVVRLLEIRDPQGPLRFWRIETRDGAWAGHATEQGRFSRRVPFREDEEDLGVWPMAQGVAQVLGAAATVRLQQVAVPEPASATPTR
jgi:hypothetical protein